MNVLMYAHKVDEIILRDHQMKRSDFTKLVRARMDEVIIAHHAKNIDPEETAKIAWDEHRTTFGGYSRSK